MHQLKNALFSVSGLKGEKLIKSKPTWKLKHTNYFRVFWIFLLNVIEIDSHNFELYRFKVESFFETQCTIIRPGVRNTSRTIKCRFFTEVVAVTSPVPWETRWERQHIEKAFLFIAGDGGQSLPWVARQTLQFSLGFLFRTNVVEGPGAYSV